MSASGACVQHSQGDLRVEKRGLAEMRMRKGCARGVVKAAVLLDSNKMGRERGLRGRRLQVKDGD
jgi:hypothetical protein